MGLELWEIRIVIDQMQTVVVETIFGTRKEGDSRVKER